MTVYSIKYLTVPIGVAIHDVYLDYFKHRYFDDIKFNKIEELEEDFNKEDFKELLLGLSKTIKETDATKVDAIKSVIDKIDSKITLVKV